MNISNPNRPATPESPLTSSLYHATSTIDDLTAALTNFSRVPSPEPSSSLNCCCGKEECESLRTWLVLKSRLGSRLILSAEVGQALLQRHEAYVRQHERKSRNNHNQNELSEDTPDVQTSLHLEIDDLTREKARLEKSLNQALVNNEVTEVSNKTILQELQDARETISRLTAYHARSVGWDTRLSAAMRERDDMQQERDGETHRARLAESRFAALKDKTAKLQAEVRRLQESLEDKRHSRLELSETILQDARTRIESVRNSQLGLTAKVEQDELTNVMDSLVNDNETLKRDNAELQHLLAESREDLHSVQEELEEQRASFPPPRSGANTPHSRHFHTGSVPSISLKEYTMFSPKGNRNSTGDGRTRRRHPPQHIDPHLHAVPRPHPHEPMTPDTAKSPLSPTDSLAPLDNQWTVFRQTSPRPSSHISYEVDEEAENDGSPSEQERPRTHRPLLLLNRSRGVQTEPWPSLLSPSPLPSQMSSISPYDPRSESSSFSESLTSHVSVILERVVTLLNRMGQADALSLTNRLKRQHLKGADIRHLSRSTISNILNEATALRAQFRSLLEDENVVSTCTRKDLRLLFKLVKDMFAEMGQMRVTLNDVILDPSSAVRVSELALNPGKAEAEKRDSEREASVAGSPAGWMAPLSKLFSPTGRTEPGPIDRHGLVRSTSTGIHSRPPRFVPKLGPALAASATTVNVEFSGTGVGRSITSTFSQPLTQADSSLDVSSISQGVSPGVMGIFAGAPRNNPDSDPWIVVPTGVPPPTLRKSQSFMRGDMSTATIGRSTVRKNANRLSRNVDAVIDVARPQNIDEEPDFLPPLLERTLRRRGLSDSSIHSTFTNQATEEAPPSPHTPVTNRTTAGPVSRFPGWADRTSVFQALSRTVQNFKATASGTMSPLRGPFGTETTATDIETSITPPRQSNIASLVSPLPSAHGVPPSLAAIDTLTPSQPQTPARRIIQPKPIRVASPSRGGTVLPNLSSWAASNIIFDPVSGSDPFIASSMRDESYVQRMSRGTKDEGHVRDFY
ncbi:hypothetical protein B0H34DRAFT_763197 [Crassisporium funariophilum]|nr:hypothetical protein B0H34DRAFT_763197 [Crassisporium funariophilum]